MIFLIFFVIAPVLVILYYALTNGKGQFTLSNLFGFFSSGYAIGTLVYSIFIAFIVTLVCLILAYPAAYILAKEKVRKSSVLIILFITPMWINFTLRITALKEVLTALEGNISYYPFLNTVIGMTYDFLPFMILPLYTTISKLDDTLSEAAEDLGAGSAKVFLKVTLPLSVPGIISGIMMVFLPAMTNYVILDMLYNSTFIMGSLIGSYFAAYDWHSGSMISIILLVIIFAVNIITDRFADDDAKGRRAVL